MYSAWTCKTLDAMCDSQRSTAYAVEAEMVSRPRQFHRTYHHQTYHHRSEASTLLVVPRGRPHRVHSNKSRVCALTILTPQIHIPSTRIQHSSISRYAFCHLATMAVLSARLLTVDSSNERTSISNRRLRRSWLLRVSKRLRGRGSTILQNRQETTIGSTATARRFE